EVGRVGVKLSPAYGHSAGVGWIHCDRRLVRRVADYILVVRINVHLIADEAPIWGDHSRRSLQAVNIARRVIVFFERLVRVQLPCGGLSGSSNREQVNQWAPYKNSRVSHIGLGGLDD